MQKEAAIKSMRDFFGEDEHRINHALQVLDFAEQIYAGEGLADQFVQQVITLSGIFHDVGIPVAIKKHGSGAGPYQEQEGEPVARELMSSLGVRQDILERVCYIVRHHHSAPFVDGIDFQILWEADALVNIPNGWKKREQTEALSSIIDRVFKTSTGSRLITAWAISEDLL